MKKWFFGIFVASFCSGLLAVEPYQLGVDYETLFEAQPVQTGDQVEVRELFWYGCPHCYTLEPAIQQWLPAKPDNAEYVPFPAVLSNSWEFHARAYFTFEALGAVEQLHGPFFDSIHKDKQRIRSAESLADWAVGYGLDRQAVIDAFESFAVDTKTRQAKLMTQRFEITGVPAFVVDGKYRTSATMAGGNQRLFEVIEYLAEKSAAER